MDNFFTDRERMLNSKRKVFVGFLIVFALIGAAGLVAYFSFTRLLYSIDDLSSSDDKLAQLNLLLTDISDTEANVKAYAITADKLYLENYSQKIDEVRANLLSLKEQLYSDPQKLRQLDSLSQLFEDKILLLNEFARIRKPSREFTQKVLDIMDGKEDYALIEKQIITTTTETTTIEPLERAPLENEKEREKGFVAGLKRIFSKKETEKPPMEVENIPKVLRETTVKVDTGLISGYQPDTVLQNVKNVLKSVKGEEAFYRSLLSNAELQILDREQVLMRSIRHMISVLEKEAKMANETRITLAKEEAAKSSYTIFLIGLGGLLICIIFVWLIFRDINKETWYRKQLEKAKTEAEQSAQAKQAFLSNMSHEIRTPLNAIYGFGEQLELSSVNGLQKMYLQAIRSSSNHLLHIVNDILDLSRIESGKLHLEVEVFSPEKVLEEIGLLFSLQAAEKGLELKIQKESLQDIYLKGDSFRLKQILINLVGNAIKFTENGSVCIQAETLPIDSKKAKLMVKVIDTGIGIEAEKLGAIFENFSQADTSTTRKFGGTGLGLSISKRLAELQWGSLEAASESGSGSEFTLKIPYTLAKEDTMVVPKTVQSYRLPQGLSVLVADDDPLNILLLKAIFSKYDIKVIYVKNGLEAFSAFKENSPDLVITDIQMPEMDGVELAQNIRQSSQVPILAFTADALPERKKKHLAAGITGHVLKPFSEISLLMKIGECLHLELSPIEDQPIFDTTPKPYSLDHLNRFAQGDEVALRNILTLTLSTLQEDLARMLSSSLQQDWTTVGKICHRLKSTFGHLDAQEVYKKMESLELLCLNQDISDSKYAEQIVDEGLALTARIREEHGI